MALKGLNARDAAKAKGASDAIESAINWASPPKGVAPGGEKTIKSDITMNLNVEKGKDLNAENVKKAFEELWERFKKEAGMNAARDFDRGSMSRDESTRQSGN